MVSILEATSLEDAIETLNDSEYGLSSSIYTKNVDNAFTAVRDIEAGITYINVPTIGAEIQLPFGGVKNTGNGHRESGHAVVEIGIHRLQRKAAKGADRYGIMTGKFPVNELIKLMILL